MRFWLASVALILAPASIVSGQELKPKFGDIGGVFYTEVSENREACQQAIRRKIALCSQNTSFESNTKDQKYPGCLPIFRDQSRVCVDHFRSEAYKCQGSGSVRIEDFTGFACTVTATVVEEGDEPERTPGIAPADRPASQESAPAVVLVPKCAGPRTGKNCWREIVDRPGCHYWNEYIVSGWAMSWSGECSDGTAVGSGTAVYSDGTVSIESTGTFLGGKQNGNWVTHGLRGMVSEGAYQEGKKHGQWVHRFADGTVFEEAFVGGVRR